VRKILLLVILVAGLISKTNAVPAYPYPIKYTQPDGSVITVQLKGDERVHWAESSDGYTLLSNGKNGWEYAVTNDAGDLKVSGILAREMNKRTAGELKLLQRVKKGNRFSIRQVNMLKSAWEAQNGSDELIGTGQFFNQDSKSTTNDGRKKVFAPKGTKKLLMILIQYPDKVFTFTKDDFYNLMNTQNYNLNGAQGSVRDYFREQSYWALDHNKGFDVQTDVVGIYTAKYSMDHYGADGLAADGTTVIHDPNSNELMLEAVQAADADVDFTQYDNDGDGSVDGVYIVYAGFGQASSGIANTIWPHAGGISGETFDGKTVSKYSCSNELNANGSLTGIGVICHEFGHVCGAPDYYDTDYATGGQFPGTGNWDIMCGGCYNGTTANSGNVPSHFNPFEKIKAGWITPVTLTGSTSLSIPDITTNPIGYIYNTTTDNEYYILENRQKTGFNTYVNGHGLLIYRYSKTNWDAHANKTYPEGFYLVSANITTTPTATTSEPTAYGTVNSASCPFPGTGKTSFTDATIPSAQSWAGNNTGYPLTNIAESSGVITLDFNGHPIVNSVLNFKGVAAGASQINLSWLNNTSGSLIIVRNTTNTFGTPITGTTYSTGNTISGGGTVIYSGTASSFNDNSGLSASTTYYYQIWATDGTNFSTANATDVTTTCSSTIFNLFAEGFEGGSIPGCWSQDHVKETFDWSVSTAGINSHPASAHLGTKLIRLTDLTWKYPTTKLITSPLDLSGASMPKLKFWHTQEAWGTNQDKLRVYYRASATADWTLLAIYNENTPSWTLETITLPNPSATYYIAFEGYAANGYGVCLDEIEIWKNACDVNSWTGTTSTDWFTASNWSCGAVPTATTDVEIPASTPNSPTIVATGAVCKHITIDNGAMLTMGTSSTNDLTINGSITINGTLAATTTNSTINIAGDWTNNGAFNYGISSAGSKVNFNGTNSLQTINGAATTNFYILQVKKGSINNILEVTSPIGLKAGLGYYAPLNLVSGTFKLSSNSTITPFTNQTSILDNCAIWNNGGTIEFSGKDILIKGLFKQTSGVSNFRRLQYRSTGGSLDIQGGSVNISNAFTYFTTGEKIIFSQSGGVININSSSLAEVPFLLSSTSTFNMSGGTITIKGPSTTADISDYQNLASTYIVTGGTIQIGNISTTGSPIIRINSTAPVYNLTVNATGTPTAKLLADLTVKGDVTIGSNAMIDVNSLNLSVASNWLNNGGSLTTPLTGTVTFNGTAAQSIAGSSSTTFNNLTIDNTTGVTANGPLTTVSGTLLINSGKLFNVAPAKALTVNGTFTNNAGNTGFVIQSDATGTGTFLDNVTTPNTTVAATANQCFASVRNWYLSTPVSGATAPVGNTYYNYVEAGNNGSTWTPVSSGSTFANMTGYVVQPMAATTFTFAGTLNTGAQSITPLTSTATAKTGFNLVGNPYPSYVNWMSAAKTNLSTTIWYRTQNSATTPAYVFDTYNETANTGTNNNGTAAVTGMIPPMQAFWVKVDAGKTGTLAFDNSMRSHQDVSTNKFRAPAANATQQVLRLQVSNGTNTDEAIVLFNANAADRYDAYDSQKMTNANNSIPEIYTSVGTEKLVINGLNSIATNSLVPLGFSTGVANTFSIKASEVSNFDADTKIVLKDNMLKVEQDITDGTPYNFTSDVASTDNRFSVVFKSRSSTTGIDNSAEKETIIVSKNANNQIVVTSNTNGQTGVVTVSNAIGQKLHSATITEITTVITKSFSPGVYLVTVNEGEKHVTKKVIIN
jgi:M6 family metalloprotease-like protein